MCHQFKPSVQAVKKMHSGSPYTYIKRQDHRFINLYLQEHWKQKHVFELTLLHRRAAVSVKELARTPRLQWCWAPSVFLSASSLPPDRLEGRSEAPQTQFLQPSSRSVGQPPDPLYEPPQPVHASRVCPWPRAEPWGARCLPQCTAATHRGRSMSSSCCSTEGKKRYH